MITPQFCILKFLFVICIIIAVSSCQKKATETEFERFERVSSSQIAKSILEAGRNSTFVDMSYSQLVFYDNSVKGEDIKSDANVEKHPIFATVRIYCRIRCYNYTVNMLFVFDEMIETACPVEYGFIQKVQFRNASENLVFEYAFDLSANILLQNSKCYLMENVDHSKLNFPDFIKWPYPHLK